MKNSPFSLFKPNTICLISIVILIFFIPNLSIAKNAIKTKELISITKVQNNEGIFQYINRINNGQFDHELYQKIVGAANELKEGDIAIGVAAANKKTRTLARDLLSRTKIKEIHETPLFRDEQQILIWKDTDKNAYYQIKNWTIGELKSFILNSTEGAIKKIMPGLDSDVIGSVTKLMSNKELIKVGQKIFNPLPGSKIGSPGYLGARIQPNSPTENSEDIAWQVFNGFSYAVGDVMLGNNPTNSSPESVFKTETTLKDIVETFGLKGKLPWSVLAHIDVQNTVEKQHPGSTSLWFQSIAGVESANKTFGISVAKMMKYATDRTKKYGLYLETGQGADFTNRHDHGFDMVLHESRKYGFARALKHKIATVKVADNDAWIVVNDVSGFIGPEVFRTKEQLVRTCLEDIAMGKLHGLTIGLDICSTLHMSISLDDLEWCQDQIMPANPGYLMALPTRNDPMLSYLTTSYQDHVRIREKFGYKVDDVIWDFFKSIKIIDKDGKPTKHFGDPNWVYYQYKLRKGDKRPQKEILKEGKKIIKAIQARGVILAIGHGKNIWNLEPSLNKQIHHLYSDSKKNIWTKLSPDFIRKIPNNIALKSNSKNRDDYIGHPITGETLDKASNERLIQLKKEWKDKKIDPNVVIVISDGLNANSLMKDNQLLRYCSELRKILMEKGYKTAPENIIIINGRVRAGYRVGETLFAKSGNEKTPKSIIHIIGERPGNGHQTFSAYIVAPSIKTWNKKGAVDHNHAKLVSNISDTAFTPKVAAAETVELMQKIGIKPSQ